MYNSDETGIVQRVLGRQAAPDDLDLRPVLGVEEVSQLLGLPKATLYRWHLRSTEGAPIGPRAFRVGRCLRFTLPAVRAYIQDGSLHHG